MSVTMRSNDAYWGLPHDVFCFTMLQEMMARRLSVDLGEYYHYVGSMHIYENFLDGAREYVAEGVQRTIEMPAMPPGDPFTMVARLLDVERRLRAGELLEAGKEIGAPYWADIVRLLQVFWARKWATNYLRRLDELERNWRLGLIDPMLTVADTYLAARAASRADQAAGGIEEKMWPSRTAVHRQTVRELQAARTAQGLKGLPDAATIDTLAMQFVPACGAKTTTVSCRRRKSRLSGPIRTTPRSTRSVR